MVYQTLSFSDLDYNSQKNVGWNQTIQTRPDYQQMRDISTLEGIQKKISELLMGLDKSGRPIVVPIETISNVMTNVFNNNRPKVGDIHSRYIQESVEQNRNDVRDIVDQTIEIIVTQIRNEYEIAENNSKLTIWNTLYGTSNTQGLRQHAPIKLREKKYMPMRFNMNY